MADCLASLRRLGGLGARVLYPGHGPVVDDPAEWLRRTSRTARNARRRSSPRWPSATAHQHRSSRVRTPTLIECSDRNVLAHLDKLMAERRMTCHEGGYRA